jgi:hypothetical protein
MLPFDASLDAAFDAGIAAISAAGSATQVQHPERESATTQHSHRVQQLVTQIHELEGRNSVMDREFEGQMINSRSSMIPRCAKILEKG